MTIFYKRKKIKQYLEGVKTYITETFTPLSDKQMPEIQCTIHPKSIKKQQNSDIRYSLESLDDISIDKTEDIDSLKDDIKCKLKTNQCVADSFNFKSIEKLMRKRSSKDGIKEILRGLDENVDQSFVERLVYYINQKGLRDSAVYKAAQVDKRLFSKIVSDREYKPSKDTAIALAFGLKLNIDEANDLLFRAGYAFSHSNKRDIIIEYFFRENTYDLIMINEVLYQLNQKAIGRF